MGNFTRRVIAFIMGMVVMLVTLLGGTAGAMYWAFKNLSLSKLGVMEEDASGIADATVEDLVALVLLVQSDPESFTFAKLEEQGIDVFQILESLGLDLSKADKTDYDSLKNISPFLLFSNEGLYQISFSTVFAFIPKGEDGTYPLFSEGARDALRGYSLGYLLETDNITGEMRLFKELSTLKIGSLFPSMFTETYDSVNGEYVYLADNPAIEKFGNIKASFLTKAVSDTYVFDIGQELHEGDLEEIGKLEVADFLSDLIAGDDEDAKAQIKQTFAVLGNLLVKELFAYDEELGSYAFDMEAIFSTLSIGGFLGYVGCTESEDCPIHEGVGCDGEWYLACIDDVDCPVHGNDGCLNVDEYKKVEGETAEELIMLNLANLNINNIIGGEFAITDIIEGVYLGHSLGYKIKKDAPNGYCDKDCETTELHDEHNFYWIDANDEYVGELFNDVSNTPLVNAINGEGIDLEGIVNDAMLGELLGKYKKGDVWYDDSDCTIPTANETAMEKILLSLYDKKMTDITSDGGIDLGVMLEGIKMGELMGYTYDNGVWYDGNEALDLNELNKSIYDMEVSKLVNGDMAFDDVLDGLLLGELMGYTIGEKDGYCKADCANEEEGHKHNYYWLDGNAVLDLSELDKALYEIDVADILNGDFEVNDVLDEMLLGELMGYTYESGVWYDGNAVLDLNELDKALYEVAVADILNGSFEVNDVLDGLLLGELMGYTFDNGAWYDENDALLTLNAFNKALYKVEVSKMLEGNMEIGDILDGLKMGELMGYEIKAEVGYCDAGCELTESHKEHNFYWVDKNGASLKLNELDKALYRMEVSKIIDGNFEIGDILNGLMMGELMGYEIKAEDGYCNADCSRVEDHKHNFYWVDKNGAPLTLNALDKALYKVDVSKIVDGKFVVDDILDGLKMGELMGYTYANGAWYTDVECNTKVENSTAMDKIMVSIYGKTMDDVKDGLKLEEMLDGIMLGELMGYTLGEKDGYCKADCDSEEVGHQHDYYWLKDGAEQNFTKFDKTLYETLVSELVTGEKDFKSVLGGLHVGELMGNTYDKDNGVWYKENGDVLELGILDKTIYEVPVTDILNNDVDFKDVLGDLYVGQLMNYTGGVGTWEKNGVPVSNLNKTVADIQLSEIFSGEINFKSKIDNLTLGDVIDMDAADTPTILKLLKDTKVSQISTKMNEMYLGEVMGYTIGENEDYCKAGCAIEEEGHKHNFYWVDENGYKVDGLNAKIANYTFKEFADDGFDINEFTLGDVITDDKEYQEGSIFYMLDVSGMENIVGVAPERQDIEKRKSISMKGLSQRIQKDVQNATLEKLMNCGVFSLSDGEATTLDKAFLFAYTNGKISAEQLNWQLLTLDEFIHCVIAMLQTGN